MMVQFNYRTEPYAHQREALVRSYDKRNYAYFHGDGLWEIEGAY